MANLSESYNDAIFNANDFFNNAPVPRAAGRWPTSTRPGWAAPFAKTRPCSSSTPKGLRYALPSYGVVSVPSPQFEQYALATFPPPSVPLYQDAFNLYNNAPGINRAVPVTTGTGCCRTASATSGCGKQKVSRHIRERIERAAIWRRRTLRAGLRHQHLQREHGELRLGPHRPRHQPASSASISASATTQACRPPAPARSTRRSTSRAISPGSFRRSITLTSSLRALVNNFVASGNWYSAVFGVPDFSEGAGADAGGLHLQRWRRERWRVRQPLPSPALPTGRRGQQFQVIDDLSWNHGSHTMQVGINHRSNRVTDTSIASGSQVGAYTFSDLTGFRHRRGQQHQHRQQVHAIVSAAAGRAHSSALVESLCAGRMERAQRTQVTYGIRFEQNGNPSCVDKCFSRFNTGFLAPVTRAAPTYPITPPSTPG